MEASSTALHRGPPPESMLKNCGLTTVDLLGEEVFFFFFNDKWWTTLTSLCERELHGDGPGGLAVDENRGHRGLLVGRW
jgi:hypothetical protein